ncbi:Uncharacterised protein [Mycobacterium tuberculosis]|nr:Uncharacterised protein [Mycobacterium tuberculosis]SGC48757.1 Uncharacterised protein [Mycobacterium tuberculosis]SGE30055.1 Uncharacterised protein [Mycobacterium tuberculosis]SGE88214.1 Uncharacterised protein [Mycobacterium tuberculosis]SGF28658.1 Uncharacterised protein [Mycobacterium tuberculosis]
MAPVSLTRGLPHISVTTSISRWMSSGNTGRCANRDPDQALITASFAAQRAARCRAADELLSEASRRSPGVKVSANTVPGWSTCSAKSGMETRSIPTPTMPMGGHVNRWPSPATMRSALGAPPACGGRTEEMPGSQAKEHAASVYPWRRHAEHRRPERTFGAQRQGQPIYASPSPSRAAGFSSIDASCGRSGAWWSKRRSPGRWYIGAPPAIAEASRR